MENPFPYMPFANPAGYALDSMKGIITRENDVTLSWMRNDNGITCVQILVNGELLAVLAPKTKPGWCRNAAKDGPLAKTLGTRPT